MEFTSRKHESTNQLMSEGPYEAILKNCEETSTKNGKPTIKFEFVIRSDVEQKYQNKHVFKNFYKNEANEWPNEKIAAYAASLGIPDGEKFELGDLVGKCCVIVIKHFVSRMDGIERECIYYTEPTKMGQLVQEAPKEQSSQGFTEVADDDLPF